MLLKLALDRISALEAQVKHNSKNSSKPPSSDQKKDKPENSERPPRKSRPGCVRTLYPQDRVNHHVDCGRDKCPYCNSSDLNELYGPLFSWQQVDLSLVQAVVNQFDYRRYRCQCCCQGSVGSPPAGIALSAFGPKLMALIAELTGKFHYGFELLGNNGLYGVA